VRRGEAELGGAAAACESGGSQSRWDGAGEAAVAWLDSASDSTLVDLLETRVVCG